MARPTIHPHVPTRFSVCTSEFAGTLTFCSNWLVLVLLGLRLVFVVCYLLVLGSLFVLLCFLLIYWAGLGQVGLGMGVLGIHLGTRVVSLHSLWARLVISGSGCLVPVGFRCGLMELAEFSDELMACRGWVVPVRHSGHLVAFLLFL